MAAPRRIGILTGGGDVPGLNSVIKSVVYRATDLGYEVVGIRRGWEGLTHQRRGTELDPEYVRILDRINTRTIDRTGGTILHSSRTNPRKMRTKGLPSWLDPKTVADKQTAEGVYDLTDHVLDTIEHLGLTHLVTIGGDDTLSFSSVLYERGLPLVAIPKTMDNDVNGTEYCIGFSSAITRAKEVLNRQRTTLGSHERIGVFRIFGRDAGFTALYTAYVTSTRCVIPEFPYDIKALAEILKEDHRNNPSRYAIVITAEGAIWEGAQIAEVGDVDAFGHRHKVNVGEVLASELKDAHGHRGRRVRPHLRPALGRAGHARLDGRDHVRQRGDGPHPGRRRRPHGGDPRRQVRPRLPGRDGQAAAARPAGRLRHGPLPPEVRGPGGRPAAPDAVARRRGLTRRAGDRPHARTPDGPPRAARRLARRYPSRPDRERMARARFDMSSSP